MFSIDSGACGRMSRGSTGSFLLRKQGSANETVFAGVRCTQCSGLTQITIVCLDEKTDCLLRTLSGMYARLPISSMWQCAPAHLVVYARKTIERVFMAQIHALAFYPNLDADRHRDELFSKSLARLSRSIHPGHPMLKIPNVLHGEAPWPSAQAEISIINAYKSARDKLGCVVRCCETISNLISMAPGMGAAAADDVTPVLVYVLIQANPPSILSNVQYVQGFGGSLLDGVEGYWWTQFTAAIEFIKTLL
ncbi:unnamed protein product [Angiostrongylus costaricensis]|uniref:Receptor-mediated endocytosis protein 6 n=1 Tax=Angiostrongylus costaricensis TaxID=334426 RepID=A0A0R3PBH5_ANGCS|nr:unnamed protein product [Angiostrongylus costaricensis]